MYKHSIQPIRGGFVLLQVATFDLQRGARGVPAGGRDTAGGVGPVPDTVFRPEGSDNARSPIGRRVSGHVQTNQRRVRVDIVETQDRDLRLVGQLCGPGQQLLPKHTLTPLSARNKRDLPRGSQNGDK